MPGQFSGSDRPMPRRSNRTTSRVLRASLISAGTRPASEEADCPGPPASSTTGSGLGRLVLAGMMTAVTLSVPASGWS